MKVAIIGSIDVVSMMVKPMLLILNIFTVCNTTYSNWLES